MWSAIAFVGLAVTLVGLVAVVKPLGRIGLSTRGRGGLAAAAGIVLLAIGASNDPETQQRIAEDQAAVAVDAEQQRAQPAEAPAAAPSRAPAPPAWTQVASWTGSGIKDTESFETKSREWRITWKASTERFAGAGIMQIYVQRATDDGLVTVAANRQGPGGDTSYVRAAPGRYYLKINSANIDWNVAVEDQR